jgi:hypothetical protein
MSGVDSAVEREEGGRGKLRHAARKCSAVPHPCSRPSGNFLDDVTGLTFAIVTKGKRLTQHGAVEACKQFELEGSNTPQASSPSANRRGRG